jgi:hypothetical protein
MYCQCGFGSLMRDAVRVSHGRSGDRESAENMNRAWCREKSLMRDTAASNESPELK